MNSSVVLAVGPMFCVLFVFLLDVKQTQQLRMHLGPNKQLVMLLINYMLIK